MAAKESAAADDAIQVLFALHEKFDLMDFAGPCEVFAAAQHDPNDPESKAFEITLAGGEQDVLSSQGPLVKAQCSWKNAHENLDDYDVLVVLGGNSADILEKKAEPLDLINAWAKLQVEDPTKERTLLSVCTGSLFLAAQGILVGLAATTHPYHILQFEKLCGQAAKRDLDEFTDVQEDARFVVNNLRFDLGDKDENPYIRRPSEARKVAKAAARKGSVSLKQSNTSRAAAARRAAMRLGGLRVITAGGVSAGVDAALYVVSALVSETSMQAVASVMQWTWTKGVVVDGLDV